MAQNPPRGTNYTIGYHPSVLKAHGNRTAAGYAAYLLPHIRPHDSILDVGCGPGSITVGLAERAPNGSTVGIDYGAEAIAAAKKNVEQNGGPKNCEFKTGNAYELEWDEGNFDVVHTHQCLIHLDDPVKALKEMRRVCKVGGIVGAGEGDFGGFVVYPDEPLLYRMLDIFEKVMRSGGSEPHAGRRLAAWAREAGFAREEVQVSAVVEVYSSHSEREFIATRYYERILHSEVGRKALELGIATREEIENVANAWKQWIDDDDGYFGMPSTEILCRKNA